MRYAQIQIFVLFVVLLLGASSKLLHQQTTQNYTYLGGLRNTQIDFQTGLGQIISKLEFIQASLSQASPNTTQNLSLSIPAILNYTRKLEQ